MFLERKVGASLINDSVEAKRSRDFQSLLGLQELSEAVSCVLRILYVLLDFFKFMHHYLAVTVFIIITNFCMSAE